VRWKLRHARYRPLDISLVINSYRKGESRQLMLVSPQYFEGSCRLAQPICSSSSCLYCFLPFVFGLRRRAQLMAVLPRRQGQKSESSLGAWRVHSQARYNGKFLI
jgi:hypothetical protein